MKINFLLPLLLVSLASFSQSVNDYKAVVVPLKYDFVRGENPYRIATVTKNNLVKAGFVAFYENQQLPAEYAERCNNLYADVKRANGFLITKVYVELKDCNGKVIFTSQIGESKIKEYEQVYVECINLAFPSIYNLHYKYNGKTPIVSTTPAVVIDNPAVVAMPIVDMTDPNLLYAQPAENGYQLIDKTPKVVMKLLKTSRSDSFMAIKDGIQGTLNAKDNQWFFEYYKDNQLVSEKISVKF